MAFLLGHPFCNQLLRKAISCFCQDNTDCPPQCIQVSPVLIQLSMEAGCQWMSLGGCLFKTKA
jgi:hypothetical protein